MGKIKDKIDMEKEKYEYFLKLNVAGHAVDPKHIEYVESLLKNEK